MVPLTLSRPLCRIKELPSRWAMAYMEINKLTKRERLSSLNQSLGVLKTEIRATNHIR